MRSPQVSQPNIRSSRRRSVLNSPHREHVLELGKKRSATTSSAPYQRHLYSSWRRNSPKLASARLRLSPLLARRWCPGASTVPRAERVMPATFRSSTTTRGTVTWRSSSTRIVPVVKRQPIGRPRLRKRGKPTRGPARLPLRLSDQLRSALARAASPELYASLLFSRHHGASTSFCAFHSRRRAYGFHPGDSVRGRPITLAKSPSQIQLSTSSRPQLKAFRAAPQCEASARRWIALGSSAKRHAW